MLYNKQKFVKRGENKLLIDEEHFLSVKAYYDIKRGEIQDVYYLVPPEIIKIEEKYYHFGEGKRKIKEEVEYYEYINNGIVMCELLFNKSVDNAIFSEVEQKLFLIKDKKVLTGQSFFDF